MTTEAEPEKPRLRRRIAAPLLAAYCAVLLVSALPRELVPPALRTTQRAARLLLWVPFRIKAGEEVFAGNAAEQKQRLICVTVFGVDADHPEAARLAFQSFPGCEPPAVRLHASAFDFAIDASAWLLFTQRGDVDPAFAAGARDARLTGIARYFCESTHSPVRGADRVVIVLENHKQHYETGEVSARRAVVHERECAQRVSVGRDRFAFEADEPTAGRTRPRSRQP